MCGCPDLGLLQSLSQYPDSPEISGAAPHNQEALQRRLELLEEEKNVLEAELGQWRQLEREAAVAKEHAGEAALQAEDPEPSF